MFVIFLFALEPGCKPDFSEYVVRVKAGFNFYGKPLKPGHGYHGLLLKFTTEVLYSTSIS